jgi:hypothetical protein
MRQPHNVEIPWTKEGGSKAKHPKLNVHSHQEFWFLFLCPEKNLCLPPGVCRGELPVEMGLASEKAVWQE